MTETETSGNSVLGPIAAEDTQKALTALSAWDAMAQGAYSKNTRRAWPVRLTSPLAVSQLSSRL